MASVIVRTLANSINQPYFSTIIIEDDWESQEDGGYTYIYEDELEDLNKNLRNIETYSSQYQVEGVCF